MKIDCQHWADCGAHGCCGLGVYLRPSYQLCGRCLRLSLHETRAGTVPPMKGNSGVGTELKKLLAALGIVAGPNCACQKRSTRMDSEGVDWCRQNIDLIVDWLAEEATRRKFPFMRVAGKLLVFRAIHNFRRLSSAKRQTHKQT